MPSRADPYDVAVIGAGPAGALLAYRLAEAGFNAILIDKKPFPRRKICAGGLPAKVLRILPFDISLIIDRSISRVNLSYKGRGDFTKQYRAPLVYLVDREKFDHFLVNKAQEAGVAFADAEGVEEIRQERRECLVKTVKRTIRAKLVAGADGARSSVARSVGLQPADCFQLGVQAEVPLAEITGSDPGWQETLGLAWGLLDHGYGWYFPKKQVAAIGYKGPLASGRQINRCLTQLLKRFKAEIPTVKPEARLVAHRLRDNAIVSSRVLLTGDAAGLADFWTGEGIYYALQSAELAAREIGHYFRRNLPDLQGYQQAVESRLMPELRAAYYFSAIFNYLGWLAFKIIQKYDYPWDTFCRIMRGDRTFAEIKKNFRPDIFCQKIFIKSRRGTAV